MYTIKVERVISAPIEKVFDLLADHGNYKQFAGVKDSRLEQEGRPDRNGLGAVRYVKAGPGWFREKITAYDRPNRFDYLITETSLPLEHEGGSLRFEKVDGGTRVTWTSVIRLKVPVVGDLLTRLAGPRFGNAFGGMLKQVGEKLAA